MEPLVVHFLISLIFVVKAVSSTAQWKILRPGDMTGRAMSAWFRREYGGYRKNNKDRRQNDPYNTE